MFNPNEPQASETMDADVVRDQLNALKALIDAVPVPAAETDPVFSASEAAQLVPGDKAKLDNAVQPGSNVSALTNDAGYMANPMGPGIGDIIYNGWDGVNPGGVKPRTLPGGTEGQVLTVGRIDGMIAPTWVDNTALQPNPTADGTYPIANDGVTSGQLTGITITNGLITAVTVVP